MKIDDILKDLTELKQNRTARINDLKHMIGEVERENTTLESELSVIHHGKGDLDASQIEDQVNREAEINTQLTTNKARLEAIRNQLAITQDETNFIDLEDFNQYKSELETAYNEVKLDVYTECQELAERVTQAGERLISAQAKANQAMDIAFSLYHGNTVFEDRVERRCVGDHTEKDEDGIVHKINDFEDVTRHFEYRTKPTIGEAQDVLAPRKVSELYNTRGKKAWWNSKR